MRRLLATALLASVALPGLPAAYADPCDEYGECHPWDCMAWEPVQQLPYAVEEAAAGNVAYAVELLLPPPCPPR